MNRNCLAHTGGYILIETLVSMALLSVAMLPIHHATRDAVLMRAHAEDFTTARFLLDDLLVQQELQWETVTDSGNGTFPPPHERFQYAWRIERVNLPAPPIPGHLSPEQVQGMLNQYKGHMGRLQATVRWTRGGMDFEAAAETLLPPEQLWLPPGQW